MCGIIGYTGERDVTPILINALKRMEYRGYDSAGVAVQNSSLKIVKDAGKVSNLEQLVREAAVTGRSGIGHTRWATHGAPTQVNAHPHTDEEKTIALVHNGIIENYTALRHELGRSGHTFHTDTDTETVAHLIEELYDGDLPHAVQKALRLIKGTYGLAIVSKYHPGMIIAARMGSPMVIGHGHGENFVASDPAAFLKHVRAT